MLLSEKISMIRKVNNMTQEQFAEKLSISRQAVSKWEKGDSIPDVQMLTKIADYYNITLDHLVRDEYDLPHIKQSHMNCEDDKPESQIKIEQYIGKVCDISMNSFRYSVIKNAEIIGTCGDMVCFVKNQKYGYYNLRKSLGILLKKEGRNAIRNDKLITGKCTLYVNKGTYFGGMTYFFSEITEIKQDSIIVFSGKFESEISLDEVSVILMNQKVE